MNICVVALGKIGLPLAVQFAAKGHTVIGADVDERVVALVNAATEPFPGEHGTAARIEETVGAGLLSATTDTSAAVAASDAVVIVVPLFVDAGGTPDFGWMDAATKAVAAGLRPGTLVSYETTLPVGTTRTRWAPMLAEGSGLTPGRDFPLVFSPERVLTGRVFADLRRYPKLVGGIDEASTLRGVEFYETVLDFDERDDLPRRNGVWNLGTAEASELAKLAETTYRDVNIGLANQFARFAGLHGIDVEQVIDACNSQPYSHIHRPGIAVGGHCIPVYPQMYLWNDPDATVVRAAREANAAMPRHAVDLLAAAYGDWRASGSWYWAPPIAAVSRRPRSPASSAWSRRSGSAARWPSSRTPCTGPTSCGPWASSRTRTRPSPRRSSRPTTPGTASCPRTPCRTSVSSSTAAARRTRTCGRECAGW